MQLSELDILELHATGGMAEVYRATARTADGTREFAVKKILPQYTADKELVEMFVEEARVATCLHFPNIVEVFDLCVNDQGDYFIVMEFADGIDLASMIGEAAKDGHGLPIQVAVHIAREILLALDYAQQAPGSDGRPLQLVHRDISPQNVIVCTNGMVKLTDFGIAKVQQSGHRTMAGIVKGKFGYMSPEQAKGKVVDGRSDLFNVGILLYEMITGTRLFQGSSDVSTLERMRQAKVPMLPDGLGVPPGIDAIMRSALQKSPRRRPQDAGAFERALALAAHELNLVIGQRQIADYVAAHQVAKQQPRRVGTRKLTVRSAIAPPLANASRAGASSVVELPPGAMRTQQLQAEIDAAAAAHAKIDDDDEQTVVAISLRPDQIKPIAEPRDAQLRDDRPRDDFDDDATVIVPSSSIKQSPAKEPQQFASFDDEDPQELTVQYNTLSESSEVTRIRPDAQGSPPQAAPHAEFDDDDADEASVVVDAALFQEISGVISRSLIEQARARAAEEEDEDQDKTVVHVAPTPDIPEDGVELTGTDFEIAVQSVRDASAAPQESSFSEISVDDEETAPADPSIILAPEVLAEVNPSPQEPLDFGPPDDSPPIVTDEHRDHSTGSFLKKALAQDDLLDNSGLRLPRLSAKQETVADLSPVDAELKELLVQSAPQPEQHATEEVPEVSDDVKSAAPGPSPNDETRLELLPEELRAEIRPVAAMTVNEGQRKESGAWSDEGVFGEAPRGHSHTRIEDGFIKGFGQPEQPITQPAFSTENARVKSRALTLSLRFCL